MVLDILIVHYYLKRAYLFKKCKIDSDMAILIQQWMFMLILPKTT